MQMCDSESDVNVIIDKIEKLLIKCKFRAYGLKTLNFKHLENFEISEVWNYRLKELERMSELVEAVSYTHLTLPTICSV